MDENQIVTENMGLVYNQLHKCNVPYDDDAFSYGMEGLLNAARTYEENRDVKFSTYASVCIYNNIQKLLRQRAAKKRHAILVSYEDVTDDGFCLAEVLPSGIDMERDIIKEEYNELLRSVFDANFNKLTGSSKRVIEAWRDSEFSATQCEIADITGVSQSYVSRIIKVFQNKIKVEMEDS